LAKAVSMPQRSIAGEPTERDEWTSGAIASDLPIAPGDLQKLARWIPKKEMALLIEICERARCDGDLARPALLLCRAGLVIATFSCRGYDTIPLQEAEWRRVHPELAGMSAAQLWRCAGPPLREATAPHSAVTMVYRYADLKNYCEVTLLLQDGKVRSFSTDQSAPEFLWLLDGTNYCGRIFADCSVASRDPAQRGTTLR
jgi:hypothetical protein